MRKNVAVQSRRKTGKPIGGLAVLLLLGLHSAAHAASFDCKKAGTKVEKMICADKQLSRLDEELADYYSADDAGVTDATRQAQRAWAAKRNACTTAACVETQYHLRISVLACASNGPNAGSRQAAIACEDHKLSILDKELDEVERTHIDDIATNSHSPDSMRDFAVAEAKAWRAYRKARCQLAGSREGDGGTWQAFWVAGCEVGMTETRIKDVKAD